MRNRIFRVKFSDAHFFSVIFASSYRCVNSAAFLFKSARNDSHIFSCKAVSLYLLGELIVRIIVFCHDKQTACVLIYPMHDARADNAVYRRQPALAVKKQGIDKRTSVIACRRVIPLGLFTTSKSSSS